MAEAPVGLRLATARDVTAIAFLEGAIFPERMRFARRQIEYLLSSTRGVTVLALVAGQCVACCIGLANVLRNGEMRGRIYSLGVLKDWRGSGVGTLLLTDVERRLFRMGARVISLETLDRPGGARDFFGRRGYRRTAFLADYYRPGSAVRMVKRLVKLPSK
jgi:ribosomal protein S18 acetylase RimI-like enzyme